jgi:hypothetical protein
MINMSSFIETVSDIRKLMGEGGFTDTQRKDRINLLSFFQNKKTRLKLRNI